MADKQRVPDWRQLAAAQRNMPGAEEFISRLIVELNYSELASFGHDVLSRIPGCVTFATLTFPAAVRERFSRDNAYSLAWIYGLDLLLDTCPSMDYAYDVRVALNKRLALPLDATMDWSGLELTRDPSQLLPGCSFSLMHVVENLQPLRRSLSARTEDPEGLAIFDSFLMNMVVEQMIVEAGWRLMRQDVSLEQYMSAAAISIAGSLTTLTANALLPRAAWNWRATSLAAETMCGAARLINDIRTRDRDDADEVLNAVTLLAASTGDLHAAEEQTRTLIDEYSFDLHRLCIPFIRNSEPDEPLYILNYYIYYCLVITEAMYSQGDFVYIG